ncbi:NmrA family NAD(P)-binding protein [Cryptosporangium aurantiacum]|uniref:Uncharacterized conserved protein YbjT, contains NAD(P)-binding and DUF2867 domains n=1 Tax=Cryptosporangium aurantiacum TaxID=134849 RepID=A0A1M7RKE9_9ACTN|nr:NmrA family NAD(P)-binding protein [Cryptosporangium aurantiacum]SHN46642.1 Uncharacterized conserved protein YbjT, contains NAD(P)-binding and DUF2867 domains [Cryptosporangium aurantiacum]
MILVLGATGSIGTPLVRALRDAGEPVRAFVRDPAEGEALGVPYAVGDLDDPASVAAALDGVDRLFLNAGGAVPAAGEQPMVRQQKAAIDAAAVAGVSRVVKVSVWGAKPGGRLAEGAHWEIERYLEASGLSWATLQPSGFMQNFRTGAGAFTDDGDLIGAYGNARVSYIDAADIAACGAALLAGSWRPKETFVLTGPEALTHAEIAALLAAAWRRPIRYVDLSPDEFTARLVAQGLPHDFANDVATLYREVAAGSLAATTTHVEELTGRPPRSFAEFLAQ